MAQKITTLPELLDHAAEQGWIMSACSPEENEPDYVGTDKAQALEALEACDEMHLTVYSADQKFLGRFFIVNGLAPDEVIADYTLSMDIGDLMMSYD